jgi:nicotinamide-nucleotide amidase
MIDDLLYGLAREVGRALAEQGRTLVTAESCTGGWVAEAITDVPGSSDWFEGALVTYSNRAKQHLLGVPEATITRCGAVSEETVLAMARGALTRTTADWAIAVSGIAGPSGGTPEKPVGTVWINWTSREGSSRSQQFRYAGNRRDVRRQIVETALRGLLDELRS